MIATMWWLVFRYIWIMFVGSDVKMGLDSRSLSIDEGVADWVVDISGREEEEVTDFKAMQEMKEI